MTNRNFNTSNLNIITYNIGHAFSAGIVNSKGKKMILQKLIDIADYHSVDFLFLQECDGRSMIQATTLQLRHGGLYSFHKNTLATQPHWMNSGFHL